MHGDFSKPPLAVSAEDYFLWLCIAQWLSFFILASYKTLFAITHFYHNAQIGN